MLFKKHLKSILINYFIKFINPLLSMFMIGEGNTAATSC